ncbi:S46 family peptidase [Xylanibacter oryzae]|uniref:S46 family peptidase n=1 Tax=Xylanibacter oryzae TaxID=185293 RepID=UPI0004B5D0B1|nr:S46 family peptidase [Xylanibacter oryzae]
MKRLSIIILAFMAVIMAKADEGMWTLYNLPQAVYEQMKAEGLQMPYDQLYNNNNALKNAVVNFSGYCTGVVVSPDGLVFTNHHCGFEAIRSHSTVQNDYMLNGFCAKTQTDELPNDGMFVSFMISQKDVTDRINTPAFQKMSNMEKEKAIDSIENVLSDSVSKADSTMYAEVKPFYEGNKYYMTVYQTFHDLRLVFAPTKSMGKFGGETDNWMWPRQTCDFSVFRIYADPKTNGPAAYSKDNVPYHPAVWAPVSTQGYKDGDYAMIMGYPGGTERYLSSYGIKEMRDADNTPRVQVRDIKQAIMKKYMVADEAIRIKYDSKFAHSANYWKNSIGMNKCIDSLEIIPQKQAYEKKIKAYVDSTGYLKGILNFDKMSNWYSQRFEHERALTFWVETFRRGADFASRAYEVSQSQRKALNNKDNRKFIVYPDITDTYDENVDKEMLLATLQNYDKQVRPEYLPELYNTIKDEFKGDYAKYVDFLYSKSNIMKKNIKIYINKKSTKKDPGYIMGCQLNDYISAEKNKIASINDSIDNQERYLCAAILRMEQDLPHYSDANFTMRLTYGQVGGYNMGNHNSGYYTDAESVLKKMEKGSDNPDYFAEQQIQSMLKSNDFGDYKDKTSNKMQLCFLTNNDITGGNSGSPVFNGKGELIGLAFDGNWDALSSDIHFDKKLARTICVDIRYVLYMMDKWGHADRLINEIKK